MSVAWNVVQAVKTLAQLAVGPDVGVTIRNRLKHDKDTEGDRQIVLVLEKPKKGQQNMRAQLEVLYPVTVAIVMERSLREEAAQWEADTIETLRQRLWVTTLPGVATVRDCEWEPDAGGSIEGLNERFNAVVMRFTYSSHEGRNG